MNNAKTQNNSRLGALRLGLLLVLPALAAIGCQANSLMDPSKTGRFMESATTIPVLDRLDVIEPEDQLWANAEPPTREDLIPSDLTYRLSPGDVVTVQIYELYTPNQWYQMQGAVGVDGLFRLPEIGDVPAAGLTAQEFENLVTQRLDEQVLTDPVVDVAIPQRAAFRYSIGGAVPAPGVYTLQNADLRLWEALVLAGGVPQTIDNIFIVRTVPLADAFNPAWEQENRPTTPRQNGEQPADIESLIEQLNRGQGEGEPEPEPGAGGDDVRPGAMSPQAQNQPPVDIDALQEAQPTDAPAVDVEEITPEDAERMSRDATFFYDPQRGEWVRVAGSEGPGEPGAAEDGEMPLALERIIRIDHQALVRGQSDQNIIIRPGDRIYVNAPQIGVVYIEGEVLRPGVYNLPLTGTLTLSRLVAAAGGLNGLAIPERVDLTRRVGEDREGTVRLNLAAIRRRTEPDLVLKPDDHIIIGTSWYAVPLAVIRNGFRATYGFGFLLDRNFGNDVFGAPPGSFGSN